ncbi:MAG: hypothetical protein QF534_01545 [Phycisphaerales bacterium]|jgi:hypothetical protein|nr:hypothetical protein [Phycisphaerales bacterium]
MMKTIGLMGAACTLIATAAASADVSGIEIDHLGNMGYGETYRVYAVVGDGERIDAVFGNAVGPLSIDTAAGMSFYQNGYGGNTSMAINSGFFAMVPSLEWDSYVTIGALYVDGTPFGSNALMDIGIDWTSFEGGGSIDTANGSWFVTPVDPQGGEIDNRVLVAQFTVIGGTGNGYEDIVGCMSFQGKDIDGNTFQNLNVCIPAPGALALIGFAGIVGRRRRR